MNKNFFNEFLVQCPNKVDDLNNRLLEHGILGGFDLGKVYPRLEDHMLIAVTEMNRKEDIDLLCTILREVAHG
jgi:glycine dehydrogenase subunit 1